MRRLHSEFLTEILKRRETIHIVINILGKGSEKGLDLILGSHGDNKYLNNYKKIPKSVTLFAKIKQLRCPIV